MSNTQKMTTRPLEAQYWTKSLCPNWWGRWRGANLRDARAGAPVRTPRAWVHRELCALSPPPRACWAVHGHIWGNGPGKLCGGSSWGLSGRPPGGAMLCGRSHWLVSPCAVSSAIRRSFSLTRRSSPTTFICKSSRETRLWQTSGTADALSICQPTASGPTPGPRVEWDTLQGGGDSGRPRKWRGAGGQGGLAPHAFRPPRGAPCSLPGACLCISDGPQSGRLGLRAELTSQSSSPRNRLVKNDSTGGGGTQVLALLSHSACRRPRGTRERSLAPNTCPK